ncbi:DUF1642 domain-containing protein [Aerococcus sp. 1KP-2016]|uniref:DUF1642 domain-containing protein n=1 Tax=Aerococcus sp. 1KP-2016 TaxID=1981982 RepID=UPI000B98DE8C|nr:DUF1642 domain-containing protein [Aerococcus sp. 1KP-2016]OYQ68280.1 hypothetical protein B9P78_00275 [Aerococcus sp. 1KP-2016]
MKIEIDKPVVPQWFDEWCRSMKYAGDKETFILKVMFSVNHYSRYDDYRRDNGFFDKDQFTYISENFTNVINAIQFGYEVDQEPLYYAKIKGWELIHNKWDRSYWNLQDDDLRVDEYGDFEYMESFYKYKMTKEEWNDLGINDTNADFEVVSE